jgi:hypothetical protein
VVVGFVLRLVKKKSQKVLRVGGEEGRGCFVKVVRWCLRVLEKVGG